ncbi:MAG TPA: insulinase family protein, partial [Candidatus Nanoarchaeia archaeon]|nr:insulinase family protein [Candidatus Nanoarchaeia archaeon]
MLFDLSGLYKKIKCNGSVNKLPNGITLIAENVPDYELVNGYIDLNVGSAYETPEKKGIMHFLEHLCATHDMNKELGLMGVKIDAITSPLNISFPIKGSDNFLLKDNFVKAFKIIKNDLFKPSFNHEVIESERLTVKKEIIERNNKFNPYRDIIDSINNYLYGNNPFFKDNAITGSKESVDSITIDNLIDFH